MIKSLMLAAIVTNFTGYVPHKALTPTNAATSDPYGTITNVFASSIVNFGCIVSNASGSVAFTNDITVKWHKVAVNAYDGDEGSLALGDNVMTSVSTNSVAAGESAIIGWEGDVAVGSKAAAVNARSTAIGYRACAEGPLSIAIGAAVYSQNQGDYLGTSNLNWSCTRATNTHSIAIGTRAKCFASEAVQIGEGTNTTTQTLQFRDFTILDAEGNVPTARLVSFVSWMADSVSPEFRYPYEQMIVKLEDRTAILVDIPQDNYTITNRVTKSQAEYLPGWWYWGDGDFDGSFWEEENKIIYHTYAKKGIYVISFTKNIRWVVTGDNDSDYHTKSNVTSIVNISSGLTSLRGSFNNCKFLTSLGNNFSWKNVYDANTAFASCTRLRIAVPSFHNTKVTDAFRTFAYSGVTTIPRDWQWGGVTNGEGTFWYCTSLSNVNQTSPSVLMPSHVSHDTKTVGSAHENLRALFTPEWGGTKSN